MFPIQKTRLIAQTGFSSFQNEDRAALQQTFTLELLPSQLALTTDSFCFLACFTHGRFLEMLLKLHLTKNAFTLKFLFQSTQRLTLLSRTLTCMWFSPPL